MFPTKDEDLVSIKPCQEDIELWQRWGHGYRSQSMNLQDSNGTETFLGQLKTTLNLLVVVVVLASIGWLIAENHRFEQLVMAQQEQFTQQIRAIEAIAEKLSLSDEHAHHSLAALESMLKTHESEIRKLWDVSNKRNKGAIAALGVQWDKLDQNQIDLVKKITELDQSLNISNVRLKSVQSGLSQVQQTSKTASAQILAIQAEIEAFRDKAQMERAAVSKKFSNMDQALDAIDATRMQHTKNITTLKQALERLQQRSVPLQ